MWRWQLFWCFYNSSVFSPVLGAALLGAWAVVAPALLILPKREEKVGLDELDADFNLARRKVLITGVVTLVSSIAPPFYYLDLFKQIGSETCDMNIRPTNDNGTIYLSLVLLYIATAYTLLALGYFYRIWQGILKQREQLRDLDRSRV